MNFTNLLSRSAVRLAISLIFGGALMALTSSCEKEEPNNGEAFNKGKGPFILAVRAPNGTEYVIQADEIEGKTFNIKDNIMEMPKVHYTWLFRGKVAIGMSYQQSDPGVGYVLRLKADSTLEKIGEFVVRNRFTNYQFLNDHTFITSVGGQVSSHMKRPDGTLRNDGATFEFWDIRSNAMVLNHQKTIWTEDITGNGEQITFSSIVDMGDGTFLTAIVQSSFKQRGEDGGSSVGDVKYPDSVWVARLDTALNVKHIYRDDRISYAAGQYRAQMLRSVLKTDDGTVYVFSNAFNAKTTRKAGALRINKGADAFDPNYYFNIQDKANGYKFRRVWYLTDDKFLLELYNTIKVETLTPGHQFAIIDMSEQSLTWLQGLPAKGDIISGTESGGVPMFHNGYIYLPITKIKEDAAIYKVDIRTAVATKITTIKGAEEVRSIGYLK